MAGLGGRIAGADRPAPTASTDTASTISLRSLIRKAKRCR